MTERAEVESATWASTVPFSNKEEFESFTVPGRIVPNDLRDTRVSVVGPRYFETMEIALVAGRTFDQRDATVQPGAIINQTMAERIWGRDDPIGETLEMFGVPLPIVGIAADSRYGRHDEPATPFVYLSNLDAVSLRTMHLLVKVDGNPLALLDPGATVLREIDATVPLSGHTTLGSMFGLILLPQRLAATLFTVFGVLTLILATAGVYGVVSYVTNERTREFGIRFALGATAADVLRTVAALGLAPVGLGIATGIIGALAFASVARGFLFGVSTVDPVAFAIAAMLLAGTAVLAGIVPASRAARTDPMSAIRTD